MWFGNFSYLKIHFFYYIWIQVECIVSFQRQLRESVLNKNNVYHTVVSAIPNLDSLQSEEYISKIKYNQNQKGIRHCSDRYNILAECLSKLQTKPEEKKRVFGRKLWKFIIYILSVHSGFIK